MKSNSKRNSIIYRECTPSKYFESSPQKRNVISYKAWNIDYTTNCKITFSPKYHVCMWNKIEKTKKKRPTFISDRTCSVWVLLQFSSSKWMGKRSKTIGPVILHLVISIYQFEWLFFFFCRFQNSNHQGKLVLCTSA